MKFLSKLIEFILGIISNKTELDVMEIIKFENGTSESIKDVTIDIVVSEGAKFLIDKFDFFTKMSKEEKEYALKVAYLKSIDDLSELSINDLMEYRELVTKATELGVDVAEQLHSFWTEFTDVVVHIRDQFVDVGVKSCAMALKMAIPIL